MFIVVVERNDRASSEQDEHEYDYGYSHGPPPYAGLISAVVGILFRPMLHIP